VVWCVATQTIGRPLSQFNFLLKLMTISCAQPSWELQLVSSLTGSYCEGPRGRRGGSDSPRATDLPQPIVERGNPYPSPETG
jgi:hypothetical protein